MRPVSDPADDDPSLPDAAPTAAPIDAESGHPGVTLDVEHPHLDLHLGAHDVDAPHELGPVARFDDAVDRLLDQLRGTEPADRIFYAATELGDFGLIWLLLAATRAAASDRNIPAAVRVFTVLGAESVLVNGAIKSLFKRERPVVQEERPYNIRIPLTTSFPSGHASSAMVAAILLSDGSRAWPLYWGLAGLVAASRPYVRIHHASDVVGGLALGIVLGTVAKKVWPLDRGPVGLRRFGRGNAG